MRVEKSVEVFIFVVKDERKGVKVEGQEGNLYVV